MTEGAPAVYAWWSLLEHHPGVMLLIDATDGRIVDGNRAAVDFYGYDRTSLRGLPVARLNPMPPDELRASLAAARDADGKHYHVRHVLANGDVREVSVLTGPIQSDDRSLLCAIIHDETERNEALRGLERSQNELDATHRRFEALVERTTDPIVVVAADGEISYRTPAASTFLGETGPLRLEDLLDRIDPRDRERLREAWRTMVADQGGTRRTAVQFRRADGRIRHLDVTLADLRHLAAIGGVVVTAKDLTDELAVRARLEHQATHDGLTGLANRSLLFEHLRSLLGPGIRSRPEARVDEPAAGIEVPTETPAAALVMLDLAGMSGINDRIGHQTGDLLLRSVAQRLERLVADDGLVARTSGDEFAVVLHGVGDIESAQSATLRLATAFDDPFATPGGGTVALRARFGVAVTLHGDNTVSGLLQDAALALRAARTGGAEPVRICDDELRVAEQRRISVEHGLTHPAVTDQLWTV
ncbi:MAG: diguanylate cyclase, partial [Nitriliruptoraceae bacterium]